VLRRNLLAAFLWLQGMGFWSYSLHEISWLIFHSEVGGADCKGRSTVACRRWSRFCGYTPCKPSYSLKVLNTSSNPISICSPLEALLPPAPPQASTHALVYCHKFTNGTNLPEL
jgi:hypothetical protein